MGENVNKSTKNTVSPFACQFLRWCVEENGVCHHNWECCDKMLCSDHFGVGKCIPLTQYPGAWPLPRWPQPPAFPAGPAWYGPFPPLKPKKKKKKKRKKTKIFIKVAGDLTGLTVKAKKKSSLLKKV